MQNLKQALAGQFMHPRGVLGRLAGHAMARKNRERIGWVVAQLGLQDGQRVLEIGYGPGVAIEQMLKTCPTLSVTGLDASGVMHRQASRRNRQAVAARRARLRLQSADSYDGRDGPFDLVFSINTMPFLEDPGAVVARAREWLQPGGRFVVVHQPPMRAISEEALRERAERIFAWLTGAGFGRGRSLRLPARPNPVLFCEGVLGD